MGTMNSIDSGIKSMGMVNQTDSSALLASDKVASDSHLEIEPTVKPVAPEAPEITDATQP